MSPRGISAAQRAKELAIVEHEARQRRRIRLLAALVAALVLAAIAGTVGYQTWLTRRDPETSKVGGPDPGTAVMPSGTDPIRVGRSDATHVVVLWEDAHCSHCAALEAAIGPTLETAIREGRARLELYPLAFIDAGSARAAAAQACAAGAGRQLNFHTGLWTNPRSEWTTAQLQSLARNTGGDKGEEIATCIAEGRGEAWSQGLDAVAQAQHIEGTPTISIDGVQLDLATVTTASVERALR